MQQSIELFSGKGTVSSILSSRGYKTFKVDYNPKVDADLHADICNLNCGSLPGSVYFLWASPECTRFSRAAAQKHWIKKTVKYRIYDYQPATEEAIAALLMISATINIIKQLKPVFWVLENPVGRLHHTAALKSIGHYRYMVNYYQWGFPYSKETYIFTNLLLPLPVSVPKLNVKGLRTIKGYYNRSAIPEQLINFIVDHIPHTTAINQV